MHNHLGIFVVVRFGLFSLLLYLFDLILEGLFGVLSFLALHLQLLLQLEPTLTHDSLPFSFPLLLALLIEPLLFLALAFKLVEFLLLLLPLPLTLSLQLLLSELLFAFLLLALADGVLQGTLTLLLFVNVLFSRAHLVYLHDWRAVHGHQLLRFDTLHLLEMRQIVRLGYTLLLLAVLHAVALEQW